MLFVSTRNPQLAATLSEAICQGIAPDGGLYVPQRFPTYRSQDFDGATTLPDVAQRLLSPFFVGDPLAGELTGIVKEAFNFRAPVRRLASASRRVSVLELFHGPTAAFKDFGARFLAACLERQPRRDGRPVTILVATSGDTGSAVAAAFHGRPWVKVVVLFPKGRVSPRQQQQLTCWGGNVQSLAVRGTFDDCQRLVKQAFADAELNNRFGLSSANSINIGRLLPQAVYHAASSLAIWREEGRSPAFIVPSGNLGNAVACVWARSMGLPIGPIVLAHNANRAVPDYLATGQWQPYPAVTTIASAMDVGDPSNMERLRSLHPDWRELAREVRAHTVTDAQIRECIAVDFRRLGECWCPHTATAASVYERFDAATKHDHHWVLVATAHPAKFNEVVEPLIGRAVSVPAALDELLKRPGRFDEISSDLDALRAAMQGGCPE